MDRILCTYSGPEFHKNTKWQNGLPYNLSKDIKDDPYKNGR